MQRSPIIFYFFLILFAVSCQKETQKQEKDSNITIDQKTANDLSSTADTLFDAAKYDNAYRKYNAANLLFKVQKDSNNLTYNLIKMAKIQQIVGDYAGSEETLIEAIPYAVSKPEYKLAIQNLLGINSKEQKNYEDAIGYYNYILETVATPKLKFTPINNIATVYIEQARYPEAIALLEPALKMPELDSLPHKKVILMDNLGYAQAKNGAPKIGLPLMEEALVLRKQAHNLYGCIESYSHLADFYKSINIQKSLSYAQLALHNAKETNSVDEQLQALSFLMRNTATNSTNTYAQEFVVLDDSIKKVRNNAKNQFAKIKYDATKANLENIELKEKQTANALEIQTERNKSYFFGFGILFLLLAIAFLIHYFKNKNAKELLQASYITETRISKQLHDELANDVYYAMTFAQNQDLQNPTKMETLVDNLDQIYKRTRNISKENNVVDTGEHFELNLKQMLSSYKSNTVEVILKTENSIDWSAVDDHKKIAIQRVLQELMVNMQKYSKANFVIIGFNSEEKRLLITYSDNGIGCSQKLILKNGLQNAENRIHGIKGLLTFDTQTHKGFKAKIIIPK
ncbi:hypothetical protein FFWV33_12325 [Flavobacterium faecale]|uniref:Uncharacterized protein n=1 Tax=Flavobacterium faecale TaxID=1355330 RepID=A0A2S1LET7_9FLAO|nr:tetratricopeptide repeat protein [Flavobacterium faecale]AWG22247.1 hypothetical protein FFWV33_12325 [Flavobacterium faecale]